MPVSGSVPPVVARPNACVSRSNSPHLTPPSARTVCRHGIDPQAFHQRQVNHQAALADARASEAMRPAAHGHQQMVLTGEVDRLHDVGDPNRADDQARPPVDIAIPNPAGLLIAVITGSDEWAAEALLEGSDSGFLQDGVHAAEWWLRRRSVIVSFLPVVHLRST